MSIKVRNKSALHQNIDQNNGTQQSLLKIESVVPKLSSRTLKLNKLTRSHSTLTSAYIKKVTESKRTFVVGHHAQQQHHQAEQINGTDSAITVSDGIYTIRRTTKDREKLPDRINLDRKGLTMIPAIEDEPNLRLLSLQHNLINVFHVPLETNEIDADGVAIAEIPSNAINPKDSNTPAAAQSANPRLTRQLSRQRSINGRNQLYMNNNQLGWSSNGTRTPGRITPTQQPPNTTTTFLQKSLLLNAQPKHILRKSNSFIQNYPNLFNNKSQHFTSGAIVTRNKLAHTPSFSVENLNNNNNSSNTNNNNNNNVVTNSNATIEESTTDNTNGLIESPRIEVKHNLGNLVFLDLYDNQIETITNLDGLKSLTVLLLGKNRITDVSGLISVKHTLRVLDLHGNKISNISQKISPLQELKSLNLAGNLLKQINDKDFSGLFSLKELNLKRNKLRKIVGFEDLRNLERLWLCHNELQRVEDMCTIARAINLKEVTIENNPVSLAGDCASFLISYLPNLVSLSQMQITEQVRRAAAAWRKNKEASDANYLHLTTDVCMNMRREEIISNARTNWELLRGQQTQKPSQRAQIDKIDLINHHIERAGRGLKPIGKVKRSTGNNNNNNNNNHHHHQQHNKKVIKQASRDNSVAESEQGGEDYFRLPPILAPFLDQQKDFTNSTSSLGPNVDSGSSLYSSDNEEKTIERAKTPSPNKSDNNEEKVTIEVPIEDAPLDDQTLNQEEIEQQQPTIEVISPKINELQIEKPEMVPITIQELSLPLNGNVLDDVCQIDKQSNISSASVKSDSNSVGTNVSSSERTEKCKSALPKRQNTLTNMSNRAQTARNPNNNNNSNNGNNSNINGAISGSAPKSKAERDREQGGDYLIEICGRYLNVYGYGALKFIDKQWNVQKASDVHTVKFSYINYNNITAILCKIKTRFPNAENFVFRETNIYCLGQLNALAETQGLITLSIDPEGNPITEKQWRSYGIYRLSHWGLKMINGEEITEDEIHTAEAMYTGLSDLVLWSLPEGLLQPLLTRLRLDETCQASKMTAKEWLMQAEASLKSVVGKEALQWKKNSNQYTEEIAIRDKGKKHFTFMMENTCNAVEKLQRLETLWHTVLVEMIRNTLLDYSQIETYVKGLMQEFSK